MERNKDTLLHEKSEGNECVYTSPVYSMPIVAGNAIGRFLLQIMYDKSNWDYSWI